MPDHDVINAGVNGELAWNLRNRIDTVLSVIPDTVIIMVGTNDAMGSFRDGYFGGDLYVAMGSPQKPTLKWHKENLQILLETLRDRNIQNRVVLTIPPLGEVRTSSSNKHVDLLNSNIAQVAQETGTTLLDLNAELWKELEALGGADVRTKEFTGIDLWAQTFGSLLYNVFGWSWNDVGEYNNKLKIT